MPLTQVRSHLASPRKLLIFLVLDYLSSFLLMGTLVLYIGIKGKAMGQIAHLDGTLSIFSLVLG
jgi:hypothetical protein